MWDPMDVMFVRRISTDKSSIETFADQYRQELLSGSLFTTYAVT